MGKDPDTEGLTFNPWWGCAKVSPACQHCYAETMAVKFGCDIWGPDAPRRFFANDHWKDPLIWNYRAYQARTHYSVLCASMADIFEDRRDLDEWRARLWHLVEDTPNLNWMLLTKRPECVMNMTPWSNNWPPNAWIGATVENQEWAEKRVPILLKIPARVRFLSCGPILGPIDLSSVVGEGAGQLHWIIASGESGPQARPMDPDWVRQLREYCETNDVAFDFMQWGRWAPIDETKPLPWGTITVGKTRMAPLGKHEAGRLLDGRTYNGSPE